jgi:hypothetical protein
MSNEIKVHTVDTLAEDYLACCDMTEAEAKENALHLYQYVLAVDDTGTVRRTETLMPFFWLKHTVTDAEKFQAYREHLRTNDGQPPEWAAEEGFGCHIALVPFLSKGEDTQSEFYLPILLQPTEFKDQSGQVALAQSQVIDWQDKSNKIT